MDETPLTGMPALPAEMEGPVFREPWEAQAFAIVLKLYQSGAFTWPEFVALLSAEIGQAKDAGEADTGGAYYTHWLAAAEKLVIAKGLVAAPELGARNADIAANPPDRHGHVARREPVRIA